MNKCSYYPIFTARCYAERGIATANRPSVCQPLTLKCRGHIGWNIISKIISWLNSLGFLLSTDPNIADLPQREHTENVA